MNSQNKISKPCTVNIPVTLPNTDYLYSCHVLFVPEIITQDNIEILAKEIVALRMSPIDHPVSVLINSTGGDEFAAFQIVELLMGLKQEVRTYALGQVCSAGTDIFLAGDVRIATPRSLFMFHQFSSDEYASFQKYHEIKSYGKYVEWMQKTSKKFVREQAGKEAADLYNSASDVWLSAKEAKRLGIVHKIETRINIPILNVECYRLQKPEDSEEI